MSNGISCRLVYIMVLVRFWAFLMLLLPLMHFLLGNVQTVALDYLVIELDTTSLVDQVQRIHLQCGRPHFDPWVGKILWRRECNPLQDSYLGNSRAEEPSGLQSRDHKESDTTEWLTFSLFILLLSCKSSILFILDINPLWNRCITNTQFSQDCGLPFRFLNAYLTFPHSSVGKASACNTGDPGSIPEFRRSSGEGNGNTLQYSCQENPIDR